MPSILSVVTKAKKRFRESIVFFIFLFIMVYLLPPGYIKYDINEELVVDGIVIKIKEATFYEYKSSSENLGELEIEGYLTFTDESKFNDFNEFRQRYGIYTTVKEGSSTGFRYNIGEQDTFKVMDAKLKVPHNSNNFTIYVEDNRDHSKKKLKVKPFWVSKWRNTVTTVINMRSFPTHNSLEPQNSFSNIKHYLEKSDWDRLSKSVHSEVSETFQWELLQHKYWQMENRRSINYVGKYQHYNNVYVLHWVFGERNEDREFVPVKVQDIYLIMEDDDEFKLLSVNPIELPI